DGCLSALYRWRAGPMNPEAKSLALPPLAAARRLKPPVIVLGDGVAACQPHFAHLADGVRIAPAAHSLPSAAVVGQLGYDLLASGRGVGPDEIVPLYLRPSEAELKVRRG